MLRSCPSAPVVGMPEIPRRGWINRLAASPTRGLATQHDELEGLAQPSMLGTVATLHGAAAGPLAPSPHWLTACRYGVEPTA